MRRDHLHRAGLPLLGLLGLGALLAACGAGTFGPPDLGPLQLEVRYHGTDADRPLEALMLHTAVDNYDEQHNLLEAPLELGDATLLTDVQPGAWYVTVIRKQRPLPDSPRVALTTASPIVLETGRVVLLVFDDSFRVMEPVPSGDATP